MSVDEDALARMLLERGLLAQDEYEEALQSRKQTGKALEDILIEKSFLNPAQVKDAVAALNKRVRFCSECRTPVYVPRVMPEGERCPRCLGPVNWHEETLVAQIRDVENIVQLTKDELPPEVQSARTQPGRLFGKYVLVEEAGKGGAGVVYKAWDTMLADWVALKFIREQEGQRRIPGSVEARKQRQEQILDLLQEARAALRLRHDHIVAVRDIGRIGEQFYIAMDFVEGRTLAEHIRAAQSRGLPSPLYEDPAFYLGLLRDITAALHYAHTFPKPIVHCDLKPGNVLISREGRAFVMDFGLARVLGRQKDPDADEKVRGTPAYMAPEQLAGKNDEITVRTDVYAIGATLYELLAGRPIYTGEPLSILVQAMRSLPERPTEVVRKSPTKHESTKIIMRITKLEEICLKCIAREPKDRYASARQVNEEIGTVLEAIQSGRESGMVPQRVLEAQERSEIKKIDGHLTRFDLDQAMIETKTLAARRDTTRVQDRLVQRQRHVQLLERLRSRLIEQLNVKRPTFAEMATPQGPLSGVEVMKATSKKLYLLVGEVPRDLDWGGLSAVQVARMADAVGLAEPEDRLALGILCHHARALEQAIPYLNSLMGTPFEEEARRLLQATA